MKTRRMSCPKCGGFAIKLCPWCKIDIKDEKGNTIISKPGRGCRACLGRGLFECTLCEGKGHLLQDEVDAPERDAPVVDDINKN